MRGDTRFYSSEGQTIFCSHCESTDCGHHYRNKKKYPWRYYKGYSRRYYNTSSSEYNCCCDYESPAKTKKIVKKHLKLVEFEKQIEECGRNIRLLEKCILSL